MTPAQEQWLIQAVQTNTQMIQEIRHEILEIRQEIQEIRLETQEIRHEIREIQQEGQANRRESTLQISELREGQAMLAQYFREALERFDRRTDEMMTEIRNVGQDVANLRQDFLNHMRIYHPPLGEI
jgi:archaellum component FlaC